MDQLVADVLASRHPDPTLSSMDTFLHYIEMLLLTDLDITVDIVARVAKNNQVTTGLGEINLDVWQDRTFYYSTSSQEICEDIGILGWRMANTYPTP